jgi:DNA-binding transcriptional LysR family regulator
VRAGVGLAICPRGVVQRELDRSDLRVVAVPGYREVRTIRLAQSPRWRTQPPSAGLDDLLRRFRKELPKALGLQC